MAINDKDKMITNIVLSVSGTITTLVYLAVHPIGQIFGYVMIGFYSAYGVHAISNNFKKGTTETSKP